MILSWGGGLFRRCQNAKHMTACPVLFALAHRHGGDALDDRVRERLEADKDNQVHHVDQTCLLYTSPSPRDRQKSRMPSSA